MKLNRLFVLIALVASPAFATQYTIDFDKTWDYANADVNGYYNGGIAADGTTGPNLGVSFVNVSGLSNDANFTYFTNAPSMQGIAFPHDTAYMNIARGVDGILPFFYSSPVDVTDAVKAYAGPDGTGILLGSLNLTATGGSFRPDGSYAYDAWAPINFRFSGSAKSFDLTAATAVGFDNVGIVPEPGSLALMLAGGVPLALRRIGPINRRKQAAAQSLE